MSLIQQVTQPSSKSYRIQISPGDRFGKLTAIQGGLPSSYGLKLWRCRCDCGNETHTTAFKLKSGHTKSCGCLYLDTAKARRADYPEPKPIHGAKYIPLTKGLFALVSDEDYERISKRLWSARWDKNANSFYAISNAVDANGKRHTVLMHREILNIPDDMFADHIEPDLTLDNRRTNLRPATAEESARNRAKGSNNTSGFKGVYQRPGGKKWCARIRFNGQEHWLGTFTTRESAYAAYCEAAHRLHGEFARIS